MLSPIFPPRFRTLVQWVADRIEVIPELAHDGWIDLRQRLIRFLRQITFQAELRQVDVASVKWSAPGVAPSGSTSATRVMVEAFEVNDV